MPPGQEQHDFRLAMYSRIAARVEAAVLQMEQDMRRDRPEFWTRTLTEADEQLLELEFAAKKGLAGLVDIDAVCERAAAAKRAVADRVKDAEWQRELRRRVEGMEARFHGEVERLARGADDKLQLKRRVQELERAFDREVEDLLRDVEHIMKQEVPAARAAVEGLVREVGDSLQAAQLGQLPGRVVGTSVAHMDAGEAAEAHEEHQAAGPDDSSESSA